MNKEELKEMISEAVKAKEAQEETSKKEVNASLDVEKLADRLGEKIAEAIVKVKGGNSEDKQDLKEKFFNPRNGFKAIEYPSDLRGLSKDEKIVTFFKALTQYRADPEAGRVLKALVEGTDADGGYLVPEELRSEVFRILPDYAVMRQVARVLPMSTDTLLLTTNTAKPTAYWTSEYAQKTTSSAEFGRVTLTPHKLVCLLPVSQELINDANIGIVQFITQLFAEVIGDTEDKAYFTGSGTGQPRGINQESLSSVSGGGNPTFDTILNLMYLLPQSVRNSKSCAFMAHHKVIQNLRKIKDSNGSYIWSPGMPDNGQPERLYGYRLFEVNHLSGTELYFGDWSNYIIGDRQELTLMTTMEGGDAWRRDSMEIKMKIRVDGRAVLTSAFAKATSM